MRIRLSLWVFLAITVSGCGGGGDSAPATSGASGGPTAIPMTSIAGNVTDLSGAPIEGATVTAYLTNDHTNRTATTDVNGHYSFSGLLGYHPYGSYEVRVEKAGLGF